MNQPDLNLMYRLLDGVENSDSWNAALMNDPVIRKTEKAFTDVLDALRAAGVPEKLVEEVEEASSNWVCVNQQTAMLYGIHVLRTILYFSENTTALSAKSED